MINDLTKIVNYVENTPQNKDKSEAMGGRDDFLKMFLAQMQHQDPLNPMDTTAFSSQLAQFSSLEQLFNVNENLEAIKSVQDDGNRVQALDLIGKEIEAEGSSLSLTQGASISGTFTLDRSAYCSVTILNADGYLIREIPQGNLMAGDHTFTWDGYDGQGNLMDSGVYEFEVTATTADGFEIPVETRIRGVVNRVALGGDSPLIYVGEIPLSIEQIINIKLPATTMQSSTDQEVSEEADYSDK